MSKPRFKFFTGDVNWQEYGGKFISQKFNNGEWNYWLIIEVINMFDACVERECKQDGQGKYCVSLMVVSPEAAGMANLLKAFECCGIDATKENLDNQLLCVEALDSYGVHAQLESFSGNNINKLLKQIRRKALEDNFLFGFAMDKPENRIGNTGWDFISGNIGFKTKE